MILLFESGNNLIKIRIKKKKVYVATAATGYNYFEFSKKVTRGIRMKSLRHKDLLVEEIGDWDQIDKAKDDVEIADIIIKEMNSQGNILLNNIGGDDATTS